MGLCQSKEGGAADEPRPAAKSGGNDKKEDVTFNANRNLDADIQFKKHIDQKYEFDVRRPLGRGSFGTVWKARDKSSGHLYAVKQVPKQDMDERDHKDLMREVDIMGRLGRTLNCVYLYEAYEDKDNYYLVMELCVGGELYGRIKKGNYTEATARNIMRGIIQVCAQCHAKHVIYRDLKPENFLFASKDTDSPLKATDFGLAAYLPPGSAPLKETTGTPIYMAPEVIKRKYDFKADMWSAGVVAYQLLTGRLPFPGPKEDGQVRDSNERVVETFRQICFADVDFTTKPWPQISESAKDFVEKLLVRNPKKRMAAYEALDHPWLQKEIGEEGAPLDMPLDGQVVQRLQRFSTYTRFKQLLLQDISRRLPEHSQPRTEMKALREVFADMDDDGNGTLTTEELVNGLSKAGYKLTHSEMHQIVSAIDLDDSGCINYEEFVTALLEWKELEKTPEWEKAVQAEFEALDTDGTGTLSRDEVAKMMGLPVDSKEVSDAFRNADLDGDGSISMKEFVYIFKPDTEDDLAHYDRRLSNPKKGSDSKKGAGSTSMDKVKE